MLRTGTLIVLVVLAGCSADPQALTSASGSWDARSTAPDGADVSGVEGAQDASAARRDVPPDALSDVPADALSDVLPDALSDVLSDTDTPPDGSLDGPPGDVSSETAAQDAAGGDEGLDDILSDDGGGDDVVPGDSEEAADGAEVTSGGAPALLSLNLHCLRLDGTPYGSNAARWQAIASLAASEGVVALTLQEVCKRDGESAGDDLEAALEVATGQVWTSRWLEAHVAWAGTADEATEGVAVLLQADSVESVSIVHAVQGSLRRVALSAWSPAVLGGMRVTTVHLDHEDAAVRLAQARELVNAVLVDADPSLDVLVAGDLNTAAGTAPYAAFGASGFLDQSASLPSNSIDHVFVHRGASWRATEATLRFTGESEPVVSDHPGVLVRLAPAAPEAVTKTRLEAVHDAGFGHYLAIRGDRGPLSWEAGWPARAVAADRWRVIVTEWVAGAFAYKFLRDDEVWQLGENATGQAGDALVTTPAF